jgi:hypothetical protein
MCQIEKSILVQSTYSLEGSLATSRSLKRELILRYFPAGNIITSYQPISIINDCHNNDSICVLVRAEVLLTTSEKEVSRLSCGTGAGTYSSTNKVCRAFASVISSLKKPQKMTIWIESNNLKFQSKNIYSWRCWESSQLLEFIEQQG